MKISLIEPRAAGYHVYSNIILPRLGLPIMGAVLKQRGRDVRIYCQDIGDFDFGDLLESDLVGISLTSSTAPGGYQIADRLAQHGIPVVMGGPHVTFLPEEALQHAPFCVRGEGEDAITELADCLEAGSEPADVAGLSYTWDGEVKHNVSRPNIQDLDLLPHPDLSLIRGFERMRITPVQTSRGCPHHCTFCAVTPMFGKKYRHRSTESVLDELKSGQHKQVFFYDDNFAANRTLAKELCEGMIRMDGGFGWSAQVRADAAGDEELLELMHRSRCFMLYIGFESINPATLDAFNKGQKVEEIEECIRRLHKHNIMVHGMFITGADQDCPGTIRSTADFALRNRIDTVQFSMLTPLPGTGLYEELDSGGRIFSRDWSLYDAHHVVFKPKNMSPYTLQRETFKAMKRFYTLWQCVKLACRFKFLSAFLRYYGNHQLKRWENANRGFTEWIKVFSERTKDLTKRRAPTAQNPE